MMLEFIDLLGQTVGIASPPKPSFNHSSQATSKNSTYFLSCTLKIISVFVLVGSKTGPSFLVSISLIINSIRSGRSNGLTNLPPYNSVLEFRRI